MKNTNGQTHRYHGRNSNGFASQRHESDDHFPKLSVLIGHINTLNYVWKIKCTVCGHDLTPYFFKLNEVEALPTL